MSALPTIPFNMEPTQSGNEKASYKNNSSLRLLIVVCVLNSLMFLFSILTIVLIVGVNYNLTDLRDKVSYIGQKIEDPTDSEKALTGDCSLQGGSKSFLLHGFNANDGFNITVEFPGSKFPQSGTELAKILKLVEELHDKLEPGQGGDCKSSGKSGSTVLKAVKDVQDTTQVIANNQKIIMNKLNTSSSVSNAASFQRIESTIVQQTTSVQNRIGDLENIVIQTKSEINSYQKSLTDIQTDVSKIKLENGLIKIDVASIKTKIDNLSAKSNCAADLTPLLTTMKGDIQNIDSKSDKMEQDILSLVTGDKSLPSVAKTISDRVLRLEKHSTEVKQKCRASEIKLTEVLAKVGVPTEPPTASFAQVALSYCSVNSGCKSVSVPTTRCYKVSGTRSFSWTEARQNCKTLGGYLAEVDNEIESREIADMLVYKGKYWIGGTDIAVNGKWQWNYSGRSVSMNVWQENQPSDLSYMSCMIITEDGWSWQAEDCDIKAGYVCEKEANDCNDWMTN